MGHVVFGILATFYDWVGHWGAALILLALFVRVMVHWAALRAHQTKMRLDALQPALNELREKYRGDEESFARERLELLRAHGIQRLARFLPLLFHLPFFWGISLVFHSENELQDVPFLWVDSLTAHDPYFVLPALVGLVSWLHLSASQPKTTPNRLMEFLLPLGLGWMLYAPVGLVFYLLASAALGVAQQSLLSARQDHQ